MPDTGNREWRILAIVLAGSGMAVLDTTIVNVALPSIEQGARASSDALEWIVSGYALTFGLALVPAGRIGDRWGYKRLFLTGLAVFTAASLWCGLSSGPAELVAARLVQGLGAGIYYPAISAIIQRLFTGRDRSRAFGFLGGVVGISTAAGPLLGGLLVELAGMDEGWRWVFLVNVFIGALVLPVSARMLPARQHPERHRMDPLGNLLLTCVLLLILVPLVEGRVAGWPAWSWALLAFAVPAAAALAYWEVRLAGRGGEPVVQVDLLRRHRSFGTGQLLAVVYFGGFTSLFFTLSIMWQQGLGRSAMETGLLVLPFALGALATASNSFRFSRRFGRATVMAGICAMARRAGADAAGADRVRFTSRVLAADRAAAARGAGQRPGDRAQPGLRPVHGAARAGRDGRRLADHGAAAGGGDRDRGHRDGAVRRIRRRRRFGGLGRAGAHGAGRDGREHVLRRRGAAVLARPAPPPGGGERAGPGAGNLTIPYPERIAASLPAHFFL